MAARARLQGLDVLRGVAVGLVMICHAWPQTFGGAGIAGVVLFFVLSGYLITGVLVRDIVGHGRVRWTRFYVHRACRLFPALATVLVAFVTVSLVIGTQPLGELLRSAAIGLTYTADLPNPLFEPVDGLGHLWTLAIEEQFYLVWPWLLLFGHRTRRLGWVLVASCGLALVTAAALPLGTDLTSRQVYASPTSWAIALLLGSATRVYKDRLTRLVHPGPVLASAVLLGAVCLLPGLAGHPGQFLTLGPLMAVASVVLVLAAERRPVVSVLERPLLALGTISYAAYLWNVPLTVWTRPSGFENLSVASGAALLAATAGCATASWFTAEHVGRWTRTRYDSSRASIPAQVAERVSPPEDVIDLTRVPETTLTDLPPGSR